MIIPEVKITSYTPEANLYRNTHRKTVDMLLSKKNSLIKNKDGSTRMPSRSERVKYDEEARNLWRTIILESNSL